MDGRATMSIGINEAESIKQGYSNNLEQSSPRNLQLRNLLYFPEQSFSKRFPDHIFTVSIESYKIKTVMHCCKPKEVVYYTITVRLGKKSWSAERRFSDFLKLYKELPLTHGQAISIPSKTWSWIYASVPNDDFLNTRKKHLYFALDAMLKDLSTSKAVTNQKMLQFLAFHECA